MKNKIENNLCKFAPQMYSVLKELQESTSYWSEYDVPLGIVDRINDVLKKVENNKTTDTIKTTFDLRTCFVNMQNDKGGVILDKTQWEEICKLVEKQMSKNQSHHDTLPINTKVEYLEMALKLCHIHIDTEILYQILDVLKLVNEKKGETALSDICELEKRWESGFRDKLEKDLEKACLIIDEHISKNQ